ncbi:MAG: hypothetical protein ACLPUG_08765 [Acidimicrobiales bacterium]
MRTSSVGDSHSAVRTATRRGGRGRVAAGGMLAAAGLAASLAVMPAGAQAGQLGTPLSRAASVRAGQGSVPVPGASAFCAHFPVAKVSSVVGANERLLEAVIENTSYECIFFGTTAAGWEVIISMRPISPHGAIATLKQAEARVAAESAKGVVVVFTALPTIGKTAFSWTYAKPLNGGQLVGVADNTNTTGYGAAMGRAAATFGSAPAHLPVLERLLSLDMAA